MAIELKTRAPKANEGAGRDITVQLNLADNLEALTSQLSPEAVYNAAIAQFRVDAQAVVRGMLEDGKTDAEITEKMSAWKPGDKQPREPRAPKTYKAEDIMAWFASQNPEQQQAYLQQLAEKLGGVAAPAPQQGAIAQ